MIALGVSLALVNLAYYLAIDRLPVAVAIVLQYSAPALVVAWAAVRRRRWPPREIFVALLATIGGVVLVSEVLSGNLSELDVFGVAMGLASAALFASYTLLSERTYALLGPVPTLFRGFMFATLFWVVVQLPQGWPHSLFETDNLPAVAFVGVVGTLLPFLLFVWGVGRVRSERAAIAATLEPVLAAVFAWLWLGQALATTQIVGGTLVIAGVAALQVRRSRDVDPAGPPKPELATHPRQGRPDTPRPREQT